MSRRSSPEPVLVPMCCMGPPAPRTPYAVDCLLGVGYKCAFNWAPLLPLPPLLLRGPSECKGGQPPIHPPPPRGPPSPLPRTHKREVIPMSSGVWRPAEELES